MEETSISSPAPPRQKHRRRVSSSHRYSVQSLDGTWEHRAIRAEKEVKVLRESITTIPVEVQKKWKMKVAAMSALHHATREKKDKLKEQLQTVQLEVEELRNKVVELTRPLMHHQRTQTEEIKHPRRPLWHSSWFLLMVAVCFVVVGVYFGQAYGKKTSLAMANGDIQVDQVKMPLPLEESIHCEPITVNTNEKEVKQCKEEWELCKATLLEKEDECSAIELANMEYQLMNKESDCSNALEMQQTLMNATFTMALEDFRAWSTQAILAQAVMSNPLPKVLEAPPVKKSRSMQWIGGILIISLYFLLLLFHICLH